MTKIEKLLFSMIENGAKLNPPERNDNFLCEICLEDTSIEINEQIEDRVLLTFKENTLQKKMLFKVVDLENFLIAYPSYIQDMFKEDFLRDYGAQAVENLDRCVHTILKQENLTIKTIPRPKNGAEIEIIHADIENGLEWRLNFESYINDDISYLIVGVIGFVESKHGPACVTYHKFIPSLEIKNYPILRDNVKFKNKDEDIFRFIEQNTSQNVVKKCVLYSVLSEQAQLSDRKEDKPKL